MTRSIKTLLPVCIALAVVGLGAVGLAQVPAAPVPDPDEGARRPRFSEQSVRGAWGFGSSFGQLVVATPVRSTTAVGRIVFDGEGGCRVQSIVNLDGKAQRFESSRCSYSVDADGIGKSEAELPGAPVPGPLTVAFVVVDGGQSLFITNTNFVVGTMFARRQ